MKEEKNKIKKFIGEQGYGRRMRGMGGERESGWGSWRVGRERRGQRENKEKKNEKNKKKKEK